MRWHVESHIVDGKLRRPADAEALKDFDNKYAGVGIDPWNVRLCLIIDGFDLFGNMSSIRPVVLVTCNLPP